MATTKLLIEYDDDEQHLSLFELRDGARPVFEVKVPVSLFREQNADSAERMLGAAVFAFIDRRAKRKIGVRPYETESQEALAELRSRLDAGVKSGDLESQFQLALNRFADSLRNRSLRQLDEADSLLRAAAVGGHEEARRYLDARWERDKAAAIRSIGG